MTQKGGVAPKGPQRRPKEQPGAARSGQERGKSGSRATQERPRAGQDSRTGPRTAKRGTRADKGDPRAAESGPREAQERPRAVEEPKQRPKRVQERPRAAKFMSCSVFFLLIFIGMCVEHHSEIPPEVLLLPTQHVCLWHSCGTRLLCRIE